MNQQVLQLLSCPVCHASMTESSDGRVCSCRGARTHCFDFAKSGHIHLGGPHAGDGDTKESVLSRRSILDAGYYQPLSDAINTTLDALGGGSVLDAGCGEGYYTNRMATDGRAVLGIDLSRAGVELAAKRAKQSGSGAAFAIASIFSLPVQPSSLDAITNVFAPCAEEEFCRVLKPNGYLLLVGAGERHLMGLKKLIYDNPYTNPGRADLPRSMTAIEQKRIHTTITVEGNEHIQALFSMTPYYWRTSREDRAKLEGVDALTTEIDFDLFLYRKDV